jgi:hypothetical protein
MKHTKYKSNTNYIKHTTSKTVKNNNLNTDKNPTVDDLCKIEYSGSDPSSKAIILSCCLFKLDNMYKDITLYTDGLKKLIEFIGNLNKTDKLDIHIFIYYDNSIDNDDKFIQIKNLSKTLNYIKLCKYHCPSFIKNDMHRGTFGMFIRFLPLFEKQYEHNLKNIIDVDNTHNTLHFYFKYILPKVNASNYNCVIYQRIGYEWKYNNQYKNKYIDGMCYASIFIKNMYLPLKLLTDFLIKLRDNDKTLIKIIEKVTQVKDNIDISDDKRFNKTDNFMYGVDELFINNNVLNYIINHKTGPTHTNKIGIVYIGDRFNLYGKSMINWKTSNKLQVNSYLKLMLGKAFIYNDPNNKKNISKLINNLTYHNVNTLDQYNNYVNYIKKYYNVSKEFQNKLSLDIHYLNNIKKHFISKYPLFYELFSRNLAFSKFFFKNIEIIPLRR